jgi:hypothetical protein
MREPYVCRRAICSRPRVMRTSRRRRVRGVDRGHMGRANEPRNNAISTRRRRCQHERKAIPWEPISRGDQGLAGSKNPGTCANLFYRNREIPKLTAEDGAAVRAGNPGGATRR